jgi:hypothetical protein
MTLARGLQAGVQALPSKPPHTGKGAITCEEVNIQATSAALSTAPK